MIVQAFKVALQDELRNSCLIYNKRMNVFSNTFPNYTAFSLNLIPPIN